MAATAGQWAKELVDSLLRHGGARGAKLAVQPLHPADFAGLNRRQRQQLHGQLLRALAREVAGRYELVDRSSLADVARALEDSVDSRWQESYLRVLKEAQARINIVCRSTPGTVSLLVECNATDIRDGGALASASASFALDWLERPIALNLAVGEIAQDVARRVGDSARLENVRIVDGATGEETGLSKHVAGSLEYAIGRTVGGGGGAGFRLEGTLGKTGSRDGRLLLRVRLSFDDGRSRLFQEYVAKDSVPFLAPAAPEKSEATSGCGTDGEVAKRVLPDGYTLGDWRLLSADRLKRGDHIRLVVEARAHLRKHCDWSGAREVLDLAVSGLASSIRLSGKKDANRALARISEIEGSSGEHPVLQRLQARAHRLLGAYAQEEAAHRRWLRLVPETHPDRRATLHALMRARAAVSDGKRFTASLGRAFSASAKEESAGWTDLHYAAVLNLPGVVTALVDAGVRVDVRLKDDSSRFGDALRGILSGLGHEEFGRWTADGETPLMIAAVANAHEAAATLVEAGADINVKNASGKTPLHFAAWNNARATAEWLVGRGADIRARDLDGKSTLHEAAWGNAQATAEWLVVKGADIRARDKYGETPLHDAARRNARATAEWLSGKGADIHDTDIDGETPLHEAAWRNARETVEWLVGKGADIRARDIDGRTPLHAAARGNARTTAEWLVGEGADIHARDIDGRTPLHAAARGNARATAEWLVGKGADIRARDIDGRTPLHAAARGNARATAEWLAGKGADIRAKAIDGETPLHAAARGNARTTAEWLVGKGADIRARDIDGRTPLHAAARGNARATAKWLVDNGADIRAKDTFGSTHLHLAAWSNARTTVEWLLGEGADIRAKDIDGKTPLHFAARGNARETAEWLAGIGADIRAGDIDGETPLHDAARGNARETAEWLVGKGADIRARDVDGETPLHDAARENARETAEWLVGKGADIRARDKNGNTPLHEAAWGNAREAVEWLVGKGADINAKDNGGQTPLDLVLNSKKSSERDRAETRAMLRRLGGKCSRNC
ncbi:MAG: ankyrin repeat domain-containing protein [Defluviicoccus sp.]|nr:ankyrin repeat domain-containing protein [Defluviicoccus sp.]